MDNHGSTHSMQSNSIQIIGAPIDLGASKQGTDAGPAALRATGLSKALINMGYQLEPEEILSVPSIGTQERNKKDKNPARFKTEILEFCTKLASSTYEALEKGHLPLITGGDHSVAMGSVSATSHFYRQKGLEIGLLWFDAHGDMNTPASSLSGNIHGMPLAHLLGKGDQDLIDILATGAKVKPENVVLLGIRDIDPNEQQIITESGIRVFTMKEIEERGMDEVIHEAINIVSDGTAGFHLSFDLDGCDPSVIPGTGTTVEGGVDYKDAHLLMEICAKSQSLLALDIVELNPFLDENNVSAERAISLTTSALRQYSLR